MIIEINSYQVRCDGCGIDLSQIYEDYGEAEKAGQFYKDPESIRSYYCEECKEAYERELKNEGNS